MNSNCVFKPYIVVRMSFLKWFWKTALLQKFTFQNNLLIEIPEDPKLWLDICGWRYLLSIFCHVVYVVNFCRYACHVTTGVTQYFYLDNTNHFALKTTVYSVCPSKYQDHSKPLKHLPINIWSATNTFIWLIPVVTSPKLSLMRSKIYPRWRTSHYFKWKYFKN
jgi:hypothetical protein